MQATTFICVFSYFSCVLHFFSLFALPFLDFFFPFNLDTSLLRLFFHDFPPSSFSVFTPFHFLLSLTVNFFLSLLQFAWDRKDWNTILFTLLPSYLWLAMLPLSVSLGSVLVGGFLVAIVVTLSHESEEMVTERETSYVKNQLHCFCFVLFVLLFSPLLIRSWFFYFLVFLRVGPCFLLFKFSS